MLLNQKNLKYMIDMKTLFIFNLFLINLTFSQSLDNKIKVDGVSAVIGDYIILDSDIDKTAHPNRPIPAQRLSIGEAKKFTWLLWTLSIGCVIFGVLRLHNNDMQWYPLVAIYFLAVALMMSYDHGPKTKDSGLIGNISISIMVGAVILYGASSVSSVSSTLVWWTASVVFFTNLAREIVKDCQDMEADEGIRNTLPMSFDRNLA